MISVVGEALVDLVITPDGAVDAKLGGAPYNTARACGRLGAEVRFVGALSVDRFGTMLSDQLEADRVETSSVVRVEAPTTLAAAEVDGSGTATYRFYIAGTSAPSLGPDLAVAGTDVLFTGGLALDLQPMASTVEAMVAAADVEDVLVMIDVNCRPLVIVDREAYVERLGRVLAYADVVKVSDEDVAYLRPGSDPVEAARELLALGPSAVLLTAGGNGVTVVTAERTDLVPVEPVVVVDTIGAGDSFGAGFLSWWAASGLGPSDAGDPTTLMAAVRAANAVAGVVVTRRGADPPWRNELPADWSP